MVAIQKRNSEMVDLLTADFQRRYEPNFAHGNSISHFLNVPGLRGFWPISSVGDAVSNSNIIDLSGQGRNLSNIGQATMLWSGLIPTLGFDGTNDYLSIVDQVGFDILGTEAYVSSVYRGLTVGGWFNFSTLPPANTKGVIGKYNGAAQRSYVILISAATNVVRFAMSSNGAVAFGISSTKTLLVDTWYFIVGRFDPSTEINITVNGTQNEDILAAGIPANIFNSTADFNVMAYNNGAATTRNHGFTSHCFLSTMYLSDAIVNTLFEQTRAMFGV